FMGASNHSASIDPAVLSRIGTFLNIPLPGTEERERILALLLGEHAVGVDLAAVAKATILFSGRDLNTLVARASRRAFLREGGRLTTEILLEEVAFMRGKSP
ncbi:hypothetical protein, partial [Thermus sp.]|uniref:hypothetical protein n=1 Tax=Thermus sp. TaxID=275 RepID=UPI002629F7A4